MRASPVSGRDQGDRMAQAGMDTARRFEIGGVIATSLAVFGRNLGAFVIITLLIGIPYILVTLWGASSAADFQASMEAGQIPPGFFGMLAISMIILILTNTLTQAAIVYGAFQDLRGQRASFGDCLGRGLAMLPRVVGAAILATIGIMIGSLLFIIPGIILLLMWWVFVPVIVVENAGITQSFGRSRALTSGHRWGILGILFIVGIAQWLVSLVLGVIGAMLGIVATEILNLVVTLGFSAFASVLSAVGYYYLRSEKEGIVIDDIARVFD
jgi:hypothetical protein